MINDNTILLVGSAPQYPHGVLDPIADLGKRPLGSFTLAAPFDAALVDDSRVYHGVTPVEPLDPALPAHRDVLVVTFRRAG